MKDSYLFAHEIDGMIPVEGEHGLWLAPVNGGEGGRLQGRDVRLHAVGHRRHFTLASMSANRTTREENVAMEIATIIQ